MHRWIGIAVAVILGIRGALYLWTAWEWSRHRHTAWGTFSKRRAP